MRRRLVIIIGVVLLVPVLVLTAEVIIARNAARLDDETGFRPVDFVVRPGARPTQIVWLGDSTSTGVGTSEVEDSMAYLVARAITDGPATLTILGVSGAQVHEVIDDQLPWLRERAATDDPDVVLISIGANDVTALTRTPTFRRRYDAMVDAVSVATDATVILVGIPDMGTAPRLPVPLRQIAGRRAAQLDGEIESIADGRDLHHVDLAARTSGIFSSDPDRYFSGDEFHPSPAGHEVWADAIVDSIRQSGAGDGPG